MTDQRTPAAYPYVQNGCLYFESYGSGAHVVVVPTAHTVVSLSPDTHYRPLISHASERRGDVCTVFAGGCSWVAKNTTFDQLCVLLEKARA